MEKVGVPKHEPWFPICISKIVISDVAHYVKKVRKDCSRSVVLNI